MGVNAGCPGSQASGPAWPGQGSMPRSVPAGPSLGDRTPRAPGELVAHRHHSRNMGAECGSRRGRVPRLCPRPACPALAPRPHLPLHCPLLFPKPSPEALSWWGAGGRGETSSALWSPLQSCTSPPPGAHSEVGQRRGREGFTSCPAQPPNPDALAAWDGAREIEEAGEGEKGFWKELNLESAGELQGEAVRALRGPQARSLCAPGPVPSAEPARSPPGSEPAGRRPALTSLCDSA